MLLMLIGKTLQHVTFTAYHNDTDKTHHKKTSEKIVVFRGPGCCKYGKTEWRNQVLEIPPVLLSGLRGAHFIDIKYLVEFKAVVPLAPFDLQVKLPITIGSVPLQQIHAQLDQRAASLGPGCATPELSAQQDDVPVPNIPPPTYEQVCGGGQVNDAEDNKL
ncbi:uncharacterized protein LOC144348093 [Saccoglossus kowalevskii]